MPAVGNLQNLSEPAGEGRRPATTGLGHTRWATHGRHRGERASARGRGVRKARDRAQRDRGELQRSRDRLVEEGHVFASETDAETVTHLIEDNYEGDLVEAVRPPTASLEGHSPSS